ncbi:MAG: hypothetical protein QNJ00_06680 [Woeseiaceae bacterium]|nr:hypothetical protein [Woeseiaceae bacterium]
MDNIKHLDPINGPELAADLRFDINDGRLGRLLKLANADPDTPLSRRYRKILMPVFTRPNDPFMAAEVRNIAQQTIDECIVAGSAEIVTEFALPIESRALALLLNVPVDDAEEWISWGPRATEDNRRVAAVDAYVDRQLDRARLRPGNDFFGLLAEIDRHEDTLDRTDMRNFAGLALAEGRDLAISLIADALACLAERPHELDELRRKPSMIGATACAFIADDLGDGHWRSHARLVLRSILRVLSKRVERLTVLDSRVGRSGYERLLLNFKPLL